MEQYVNKNHKAVKLLRKYKESDLNFRSEKYSELSDVEGAIVEVKIDGELTGLYWDGKEAYTVSHMGKIRTKFPVTEEAKKRLRGRKESLFVGELHVVDEKSVCVPYPKAISTLRKPTPDSVKRIRLALFDVLVFDGKPVKDVYSDRFALVRQLFKGGRYVFPVLSGKSVKELWKLVEHGKFEGLVIRKNDIIKVKPVFSIDAAVIAITSDKPGQMSALHLALMDRRGRFRYVGKVGTGFKLKEREQWLKWAQKRKVGGPDRPPFRGALWVRPERVVEVEYSRLNRDRKTPVLVFEKKEWKMRGREPFFTLISSFKRVREDKEVNPRDLRLEQIPGFKEAKASLPNPVRETLDYGSALLDAFKEEVNGVISYLSAGDSPEFRKHALDEAKHASELLGLLRKRGVRIEFPRGGLLPPTLQNLIRDEREAILSYYNLLKLAPEEDKKVIQPILEKEVEHLIDLSNLQAQI